MPPAPARIHRPVCLVILDGVGYRAESWGNAVQAAETPFLDQAMASMPWVLLEPGGEAVGLPPGQMGNSEIGHMTMGAGRVLETDLSRINAAFAAGRLGENAVLRTLCDNTIARGGALHLMGLCSRGGVHSSLEHLLGLIEVLPGMFAGPIYLHLFTDGRDTPPESGAEFVGEVEAALAGEPRLRIADVGGRYWGMDRDRHWERIEKAYRVLADGGASRTAPGARAAVEASYAAGVTDEFVEPTRVEWPGRRALEGCLQPGDGLLCFNFRADRMRQFVVGLLYVDFPHFARPHFGPLEIVTFTQYDDDFHLPSPFPPPPIQRGLVEYLSGLGLGVFKIAETEKYAHVTYFFNGGIEPPFPGEERELIPSPRIATYDLQPQMSAEPLTAALTRRIREGHDALIVCNYANGDMVGHTGKFAAAVAAVEVLDRSLAQVAEACAERGMTLVITADHGNCEEMCANPECTQPSTQHSLEPVPFIVCDPAVRLAPARGGSLAHVAPTLLELLGLPVPEEMTAGSLVIEKT